MLHRTHHPGAPLAEPAVRDQLDRIRQDHLQLRAELRRLGDAVDEFEIQGKLDGIEALLQHLQTECNEHFPVEEALARERLGPEAPPVVSLLAEHRDLKDRARRIAALLARARGGHETARDDLWHEATALLKTLSCHMCREESGVLAMIEFANGGWLPVIDHHCSG